MIATPPSSQALRQIRGSVRGLGRKAGTATTDSVSSHARMKSRGERCVELEAAISRYASLKSLLYRCFYHVASSIVNANHDGMRPAVRLCIAHCIGDRV